MATVESRVCDIDGRTDEVCTVTVNCNKRTVEIDLCARCIKSTTVKVVLDKGRRPKPAPRQRRFSKTDVPPAAL